jgi:hypothetical protein
MQPLNDFGRWELKYNKWHEFGQSTLHVCLEIPK